MDLIIKIDRERPTNADSVALKDLRDRLVRGGVPVQTTNAEPEPGTRDGGLIIGLTLAGLGLGLIQTVVSIMQYWKKENKYLINIEIKNETLNITDITAESVPEIASQIATKGEKTTPVIHLNSTE